MLEPLLSAEALLTFGDLEKSAICLHQAAGAASGLPFLELDWSIEFLRARLAVRTGNREEGRRHLHRSLHLVDLLARSMPAPLRRRFLGHPRFASLLTLSGQLKKAQLTPHVKKGAAAPGDFHGIIGRSPPMERIFETISRLRDQGISIFITGETGTGKEVIARAIHQSGARQAGPFMALDCASIPSELFESKLFGYEAGTFTGADESRPGLLVSLEGGTLFLDEVSTLSPASQAKLLQVIQNRQVRPLGSIHTRSIEVRFHASSSLEPARLVAEGRLRADLYYLSPGLRGNPGAAPEERREDIPDLQWHFLAQHSRKLGRNPPRLTSAALKLLIDFNWPGNVRQLEKIILRALVNASRGTAIGEEAVLAALPEAGAEPIFRKESIQGKDLGQLRDELERVYLTQLFENTAGDLQKRTETLRVKQATLYRWLKRLNLNPRALRRGLAARAPEKS